MTRDNIKNKYDFMEYFAGWCCHGDRLEVTQLNDGEDNDFVFSVFNQCNVLVMDYEERTNKLTSY